MYGSTLRFRTLNEPNQKFGVGFLALRSQCLVSIRVFGSALQVSVLATDYVRQDEGTATEFDMA